MDTLLGATAYYASTGSNVRSDFTSSLSGDIDIDLGEGIKSSSRKI
jgi:hypothetical protein